MVGSKKVYSLPPRRCSVNYGFMIMLQTFFILVLAPMSASASYAYREVGLPMTGGARFAGLTLTVVVALAVAAAECMSVRVCFDFFSYYRKSWTVRRAFVIAGGILGAVLTSVAVDMSPEHLDTLYCIERNPELRLGSFYIFLGIAAWFTLTAFALLALCRPRTDDSRL